ncbi:hypothetical protein ACOTHJ_14660 [Achromobacter xylosoxidans]
MHPSPTMRRQAKSDWPFLLALPIVLSACFGFFFYVLPLLPSDLQHDINDGSLGMLIGILAGQVIVMSAVLTWRSCKDLLSGLQDANAH